MTVTGEKLLAAWGAGCAVMVVGCCGLVVMRLPWASRLARGSCPTRADVLNAVVQAASAPAMLCMRLLGRPHEQFRIAVDTAGRVHATLACPL